MPHSARSETQCKVRAGLAYCRSRFKWGVGSLRLAFDGTPSVDIKSAQRIDTRLGEVQANVQSVRTDVDALQARLEKRKLRLLFVFNLVGMLSTLMLGWIVYTQVVVIQHHCRRLRGQCKSDE